MTGVFVNGNAKFDTNSFDVTVAAPLLHSPALGVAAIGGLTKNGTGTLTLTGVGTYTGPTVVNSGTFAVSGSGAVSDTTVTFAASAALVVRGTGSLTPTGDPVARRGSRHCR